MVSTTAQAGSASAAGLSLGAAPHLATALPGPVAKSMIERDEAYSSPTYTRDYPLVARRGLGCVVEDVDGNRFLDLAAGIAVCSTGHCHPQVVSAIKQQADNLLHICGCDFYFPAMVELLERLNKITPGPGRKNIFLTNSGTEATEGAIKLARFHTKRKWLISFHGCFHGRSCGSLGLTCSKTAQQAHFGPVLPMTAQVPYGDIAAIEEQLFVQKIAPDEVAAIFVEALQGEGGYLPAPDGFPQKLRALCDKHGILLVCDEVQSGIGRTGKWWAFEHYGIVPDIVLSAKGLASGMPLGAIIAQEKIATWGPGAHGSTFGGNPLACAAACATIDLIESAYMKNAEQQGARVRAALSAMAARQPGLANVRGLGLMNAVDIVDPATGKGDAKRRLAILQEAFRRGLILLGCGAKGIRFCPPLCIEGDQVDTGMRLFEEAVAAAR